MGVQYDLGGRRILVIGGSSGVGREVGLAASRAGARVAFAARRRDLLDQAAKEAGNGALAVECDVSAPECARAVDAAARALGGIDALLYATGMSPLVMLEQASAEAWRTVLDVNLVGASQVTAAALPHLRACQGRAVYVSSYAVRQSLPGLGLYRVSKVALDALIECWRMEHPDVDFTRVVVGNTADTEFANAWGGEALAGAMKVWVSRNLFPAATMMPLSVLAEAILSVIAVRGYVDDIAIMSRSRDPKPTV
ncbi:MAG TPA: SDR family oxidoreductase [Myxococcota bacterium]|nr:SDR family oxidoreductase [Myxococcota bacterium]